MIVASRSVKYREDRSPVVYIGTTKKGAGRMVQSAARLADVVLGTFGVRRFHVRVLTCKPRAGVKTWIKLERALLLAFKGMYGDIPKCNVQGKGIRKKDEFTYFSRDRLEEFLQNIKDSGEDRVRRRPARRRKRKEKTKRRLA